jgi:tetratricopeptide (TPR) repeat protein
MSGTSRKNATPAPSGQHVSPASETPETKDSRSLKSESPAAGLTDRWLVPGVCIFLAAITFAVFGQTLRHEFVNFDDNVYVYNNPAVSHGLTLKGILWAFTHVHSSNWHPLTWVSHMLDCQLYGLNPGGHHLTNVLLHTATAISLFLVLRRMTGFLWRSAFVAAVFAIHPLRVESVAWVAERKDVLSGLFFMLTLWAYTRYTQGLSSVEGRELSVQGVRAFDPRLWTLDYYLVLLFFALGLLCKPMLVTLPLVLLLLDYWPLRRIAEFGDKLPGATKRSEGGSTLLFEKLPLFGLAVASCVVTIFAQHDAIQSFEKFSLPLRLGNAVVSYVAYLGQMFWPADLAVFYPFTAKSVGVSEVVLSLVLLAGISMGVFILRRRRPYFLTGWLWYFIMLAPVIGILQVGSQAHANRYTYLPQIGLCLLLTWAAADLTVSWRHRRQILGVAALGVIATLMACTWKQTAYWKNNESLWTHTAACTSSNYVAQNELGNILLQRGRVDEAMVHYQQALQIKPDSAEASYHLGNALFQKGRADEAIAWYQQALQIKPGFAEASFNLGNALLQKGRVDDAIVQYQQALKIEPVLSEAHINLGNALLQKGRVDDAIAQYQTALQITPDNAEAHNNLGSALLRMGRLNEAITHYQKALQITPDNTVVRTNLDNAVFQKGGADEAITHNQ